MDLTSRRRRRRRRRRRGDAKLVTKNLLFAIPSLTHFGAQSSLTPTLQPSPPPPPNNDTQSTAAAATLSAYEVFVFFNFNFSFFSGSGGFEGNWPLPSIDAATVPAAAVEVVTLPLYDQNDSDFCSFVPFLSFFSASSSARSICSVLVPYATSNNSLVCSVEAIGISSSSCTVVFSVCSGHHHHQLLAVVYTVFFLSSLFSSRLFRLPFAITASSTFALLQAETLRSARKENTAAKKKK